nr:MAG TPA: hypothetical protein [Caudoviricetes sp.]
MRPNRKHEKFVSDTPAVFAVNENDEYVVKSLFSRRENGGLQAGKLQVRRGGLVADVVGAGKINAAIGQQCHCFPYCLCSFQGLVDHVRIIDH